MSEAACLRDTTLLRYTPVIAHSTCEAAPPGRARRQHRRPGWEQPPPPIPALPRSRGDQTNPAAARWLPAE